MKILALDSAETTAAVAITDGKTLLGQMSVSAGQNHSKILLPMIEALMTDCSLTYDDIDLFACSVGPGSFTGVRIGVATVKGLAFGRGKPCLGVSAIEALAYNLIGFDGILCPSMDARRSQLYNALFRSQNGKIERLTPDRAVSVAALAEELTAYQEPIYFCGGGDALIRTACDGNLFVKDTPELLRRQNGYAVALAALAAVENGAPLDTLTDAALAPVYLRPSQAERMRNGEN